MRTPLATLAALLALSAAPACSNSRGSEEVGPALPHVRAATVVEVSARPRSRHLVLLEPARRARLAPRVGGQVVAINVDEQQDVEKGQVLVRLAATNAKGSLVTAKATISRIKAQLRDNNSELATSRKLASQGVERAREVERLETQRQSLQAQLREAEGQLIRARDGTDATEIVAPFAGTVTSIDTEVGEFVGTGAPMLVVSQLAPLAAEVPLSESEVALRDGSGLQFSAIVRGERRDVKLEWLAREADPGTSTFTARLLLDNDEQTLLAGESAEVEVFAAAQPASAAVPATAIRWFGDESYVLRLEGDVVARVPVEVLDDAEELVAIEGEIAAGDAVVATGPTRLRDGDKVVVADRSGSTIASR